MNKLIRAFICFIGFHHYKPISRVQIKSYTYRECVHCYRRRLEWKGKTL